MSFSGATVALSGGVLRRAAIAFVLVATAACAARGPAVTSETDSREALARRGEAIFRDNCNVCHPAGGKGIGPALERSLARESAVQQIRDGFGLMPGFSAEKLSDDDVDAVLAYVDGIVLRAQAQREADARAKSDAAAASLVRMVDSLGWDAPETLDSP